MKGGEKEGKTKQKENVERPHATRQRPKVGCDLGPRPWASADVGLREILRVNVKVLYGCE